MGLIDLFEQGAVEGKPVLKTTGEDVVAFVDELLKSTRTYPEGWHKKFNHDIVCKVKNQEGKKNKI